MQNLHQQTAQNKIHAQDKSTAQIINAVTPSATPKKRKKRTEGKTPHPDSRIASCFLWGKSVSPEYFVSVIIDSALSIRNEGTP